MPQRRLAVSKAVLFLPLLSPWWTAALAAADPPSTPFWSTADKISAGDTAWMLTSTALVLLMTIPGLALFYAGMVRKKTCSRRPFKVSLCARWSPLPGC